MTTATATANMTAPGWRATAKHIRYVATENPVTDRPRKYRPRTSK